jgi:RNA-directed DNA polymerase
MIGIVKSVSIVTGLSAQSCRRIANSAHKRYKIFPIEKKNGGLRWIAQPAREVKEVQRAICEILSEHLPIHESASAYKPGSSILKNALAHNNSKFILKFDFESFFPSIHEKIITLLLKNKVNKISEAEVNFIIRSCMWKPDGRFQLCMGAPSSPFLSNASMYEFDKEVSLRCSQVDAIYTRYSDDITISSKTSGTLENIEKEIRLVKSLTAWSHLKFNESKRVNVGRGNSMRVTGLTLSNDGKVTIGRNRKRGISSGLNKFTENKLTSNEADKLRGELAFAISIEPELRDRFLRKYGYSIFQILPRKKGEQETR